MPITGMTSCEGPEDIIPFQSAENMRVAGYVIGIIVADEIVASDWEVDGDGGQRQKQ